MSGMGCIIPRPLATGGNWSYPELWAVTSGLRYPGYKTPTVALEPFIERAAKTVLSTRC
jgi:hypothetical protein